MPLGFSEIYFHFVWRIAPASSAMNAPTQKLVNNFLSDFGEKYGYEPIAVSVLEDHLHILAKLLPGIAPGLLIEVLKEELAHYLKKTLDMKNPPQWDDGYGIVSVSRAHIEAVAKYVQQQQKRHSDGKTNPTLERVRE